ncbi:MAG: hypothetical protein WC523_04240 [Patescibacteria group bacterium]
MKQCKHASAIEIEVPYDCKYYWCPRCGALKKDEAINGRYEWTGSETEWVNEYNAGKWKKPIDGK